MFVSSGRVQLTPPHPPFTRKLTHFPTLSYRTPLQFECVYSICAAGQESLPRSARISARGSTFSRGGVWRSSEKLPRVNPTGRRHRDSRAFTE
ncbi:hypothetical protein QQF64_031293 [Cirrhinus molitorella]|uniref:Uncharacterized protein n=1 Tax=Cirrhinus molitorella TaxID=172907 RepID=A0ABR3MWI8_9TELE